MPQTVEVPDFGVVEFPDEMTADEISSVLKKRTAPKVPSLSDPELTDAMLARQSGMRLTGITPTIAGGPPVPVAGFRETVAELPEAIRESITHPGIPFTSLIPPVSREESVPMAVAKTGAQMALGVPEFLTSGPGIITGAAGGVGGLVGRLVAAGFSVDMAKSLVDQGAQTVGDWDKMTDAEKASAVTSMAGTAAMAGLTAAHALRRGQTAVAPPVTPSAEPLRPPPLPQQPPPLPAGTAEPVIRRAAKVQDYVEPEPTEVAVKAEEMQPKVESAPQPAAPAVEAKDAIRSQVLKDIQSGNVSGDYAYHQSDTVEPIVQTGLKAGGLSGLPIAEHGYGNVVHVFRRSDLPSNLKWSDVALTPEWKAIKPVASFTLDELGIKEQQYGARAQELGIEPEPPYEPTPAEIKSVEEQEQKLKERIQKAYAPETRIEPEGRQPEHPGTPQRPAVSPDQPEVRQVEGGQAGGGNRPVGEPKKEGEVLLTRDWDLFSENLADDLESFVDTRGTGKRDYDMQDVADRFVDYAKQDKSGKSLDELVADFAKSDEASQGQIRKLRQSVKSVMASEATKAPVAEPAAEPEFKSGEKVEYYSPVTKTTFKGTVTGEHVLGGERWIDIVNEDGAPVTQKVENVKLSSPEPPAPKPKEAWEMTSAQYGAEKWGFGAAGPARNTRLKLERLQAEHRAAVEQALREGKPVPPEVLKDYPELQAKAKPTPALPAEPQFDIESEGKAMGLTAEDIAQAKAEGVTSILGLRRIEKNNRRMAERLPTQPTTPAEGVGKGVTVRDLWGSLKRTPAVKQAIRNIEDGWSFVAEMPVDKALSELDSVKSRWERVLEQRRLIQEGKADISGKDLEDMRYREGQSGKQMLPEQWAEVYGVPEAERNVAKTDSTIAAIKRIQKLKGKQQPPPAATEGGGAGGEVDHISPGNTVVGEKPVLTEQQIAKQNKYREIYTSSKSAYEALKRSVDEGMLIGSRLDIAKELLKHGDLGVKLETGGEFYSPGWGKWAAGLYDKSKDTVHVYDAAFDHNRAGLVLVHEYIHALTLDAIDSGKYRSELESLFRRAYVKSQREGLDFHGLSWTALHRATGNKAPHLHEFVAEALSNKKFQDFLARTRSPLEKGTIRTLWDDFVSWLGKSIGIRNTSALHDALRIGLDLASERAKSKTAERTTSGQGLDFLTPQPDGKGPGLGAGPGAAGAGWADVAMQRLKEGIEALPKSDAKQKLAWADKWAERESRGRDLADRMTLKMAAVNASVRDSMRGVRSPTELGRKVGELDYLLQRSSAISHNTAEAMRKQMPSEDVRAGLWLFADAHGDLNAIRDTIATMPADTPANVKRALNAALNLTPKEKAWLPLVRDYFDNRAAEAQAAGVLNNALDDYFTHIWRVKDNMPAGIQSALNRGAISEYFQFARERKLPIILEGIKNPGMIPGKRLEPVLDAAKVMPYYNYAMDRAIASREFIRSLSDLTASDGRPLVSPTGVRSQIPDPSGTGGALLIKPKVRPEEVSDYRALDHPSMRKWNWAGKDDQGRTVFYQGDLVVHPEAYERLARMLDRSRLTPSKVTSAALKYSGELKAAKLGMLSTFHLLHVGKHAIFHWTNPFAAAVRNPIDWESPQVRFAVEQGHLKLAPEPGEINALSEGLGAAGNMLIHKVPVLGPISRAFSEWMFREYIPRLKLHTFENALQRNMAMYGPGRSTLGKVTAFGAKALTPEEIAARTGDAVNAAYGELNKYWLGKFGRDPRLQRALRLGFLAPDFGEARLRFVGKAFTKYGNEERMALFLNAALVYTAARIGNYLSTGDPQVDDPRHAFEVKVGDHWVGMRSVIADLAHAMSNFSQFMRVRLNPGLAEPLIEMLSRTNARGQPVDAMGQVKDMLRRTVPITFQGLTESDRHVWESFSSSMGLMQRRGDAVSSVHELARKWKKDRGIESPVVIHESPVGNPYREARVALEMDDEPRFWRQVQEQYRRLRLNKTEHPAKVIEQAFTRYYGMPFTGKKELEKSFLAEMEPRNRVVYQQAVQQRKDELKKFKTWWKNHEAAFAGQ